ncbi:hypothetical protein LTS17_011070 [Exophiala oligosperma]
MRPGRMFRHAMSLHKRDPQNLSNLPASIGNPTKTLPQSIAATGVTPDPSATAPLVTAAAPSGFTTVTETETLARSITGLDTVSTTVATRTRIITNSSEYASLTSVAAQSASTNASTTSSKTSSAATSSAAAQKSSSSNMSTLIPAIVVPIVVVLLASLGVFWFLMRRRHNKELKTQPEFVMAGKGEKLSSRSNSGRSTSSAGSEKKNPVIQTRELSTKSPPTTTSEWPSTQIGLARPLTPQETQNSNLSPTGRRPLDQARPGTAPTERPYRNFNGPGPRPPTANRTGPPSSGRDRPQQRARGYSNPNQRGPPPPRTGPSPIPRASPNPNPRGGPSPVPQRPGPPGSQQDFRNDPRGGDGVPSSAAFRLRDPSPSMNHNARAQAPARLAAPPPGAYNGASSISQYSPIVKDAPGSARSPPTKRGPPPPLQTDLASRRANKSPNSASPGALTEENMRIARLANSSRLGYTPAEPSPSPKLPPPATRSQLIPRESPKDRPENYFGGSVGSLPQSRQVSTSHHSDRASIVSDPDDYEDIDAKSDVSSLNEFERFDFGPTAGGSRGGSAAGHSLNYFASQNSPSAGRGSPFGGNDTTYERW